MNFSACLRISYRVAGLFLIGIVASSITRAEQIDGIVLPYNEVTLSSPLRKIIEKINFDEGQRVAAGDIVVELKGQVERLEVDRAAKVLEKRQFEYDASKNLFADKLISEDEALQTEIELGLARIQHSIAKETYALTLIRSPFDGIVAEKLKEPGEAVIEAEEIVRIINIEQVYLRVFSPARNIFKIKEGQRVTVDFPTLLGERTFDGEISFVSPDIDGASGMFRVRVLLDNPERLIRPGMRGRLLLP